MIYYTNHHNTTQDSMSDKDLVKMTEKLIEGRGIAYRYEIPLVRIV